MDLIEYTRDEALDISAFPFSEEREFAQLMDQNDPLNHFREGFFIPSKTNLESSHGQATSLSQETDPGIYLCGNQIGLQPRQAPLLIEHHLRTWATQGMYGLTKKIGESPLPTWGEMDQAAARLMAPIVGANPHEVSVMGGLTANLHILLASFYRPVGERSKVILERDTFSSDYYAVQSQIQWHGLEVDNMVLIDPVSGDTLALSTAGILAVIDDHASTAALIILSGVQYLTGQVLDIKRITAHAHSRDIMIGWDLAHAVGNVELYLHSWMVDFAVWCNYKYMNAGPGAIASIFVHEKHGEVDQTKGMEGYRPRLAGWWGNEMSSRFAMLNNFAPCTGAAGYQLSNASVLDTVALIASLEVFNQTDMVAIRKKSVLLTGYLDFLLGNVDPRPFKVITSSIPVERGCQLTLRFDDQHFLDRVVMRLKAKGFVVAQKQQMMRVAPVPLYNTFTEVWAFVDELRRALESCRSAF
ncbi:Kynureninase (L-kynurenine hydrolase) [Penicillium odoratum]|uniref:Kynureninase (L-kynurenine hydrolase) n=1 Tax=Penicillium odoratum TaxID=1167516 RepID=UPI002549895D|nr:Kynureninase (L-kynurenine hydrolase) [Penicillium odoratum]KAJ5768707.1 Kynureninase (L-kynurenine hydrolase) [Penicillium odoratum]